MHLLTRASLIVLTLALMPGNALAQEADDGPPEGALEIARELGLSDDERRPDDQLQVDLLGRTLVIGGEIETALQMRGNYDLGTDEGGDDLRLSPEIKLETVWLLDDDTVTFTDIKAFGEQDLYSQDGPTSGEAGIELSEAWILRTNLFDTPLAIQLGRQQLQDRREWWWDENLDMVRLHYFGSNVRAFVGIGRELGYYSTLGRMDPEDRDIVRVAASARWDWADRQELHGYFLDHRDTSPLERIGSVIPEDDIDALDGHFTWFGLGARGRVRTEIPGKFYYWGNLAVLQGNAEALQLEELANGDAVVTGQSRRQAVGWALDLGASFELPFAFEPYLTLGYARGSQGFRQTGLQGNNGKFRGNSRFRYYGEVLRPELANLAVTTVALGVPVTEHGWIEVIWHDYRQPVASERIVDSRLDIDPLGLSPSLGEEFDLIASYRPASGWDFELTTGLFLAGPAFGPAEGEGAWLFRFKITRNF